MIYCEVCQVVPPVWGGRCKLCSVSSAIVSTTSAFSREMIAAFLVSVQALDNDEGY